MQRPRPAGTLGAMAVFVVERFLIGWTDDEIDTLLARLDGAGPRFTAHGVEHVRSLVLPEDEMCLCTFRAEHPEAVRAANHAAALPFERILTGRDHPG